MTTNKYKSITIHGHPNARPSGKIQEHVFIMSEMLGRALTDLEVVHHVDEDKLNNNPKNLQLFATDAEHKTHHMHLRALQECVTLITENAHAVKLTGTLQAWCLKKAGGTTFIKNV